MYIVLELQTVGEITSVLPVITKQTLNEAESAYHQILSYAAISNIDKHTAVVMDERGTVFDQQCYYHGTETPEPEE